MSLATRCTACGTVFRVVQDQLKISEGWVRCGRCKEVFNALEGLFDLEHEAPADWPSSVANLGGPGAPITDVDLALPDLEAKPQAAAVVMLREDSPASSAPNTADASADAPDSADDSRGFADARFEPSFASVSAQPSQDAVPAAAPEADPHAAPEFLRQAELRARWESPRTRTLVAATAVLLATTLMLQAALHFRHRLAAQWPNTRPVLAAVCERIGCKLEALRRIDDLAVESSTLTRAAPNSDALRLTVALRNRGNLTLAMPTFELSLTDTNGEMVARRALSASDFASRATTLAPLAEANLQLLLALEGRQVAGYTIEIFYP